MYKYSSCFAGPLSQAGLYLKTDHATAECAVVVAPASCTASPSAVELARRSYIPFTPALVSGPARAGSVSMVLVNAGRAVPARLVFLAGPAGASGRQPGLARVKYIM